MKRLANIVRTKRIKRDLADQLRARTMFMTDQDDVYYTPLYVCATYFSPKYSSAMMPHEKAVAAGYISAHVRLGDRYKCFVCFVSLLWNIDSLQNR